MRYIAILIAFAAGILISSCNRHDNEPPAETSLYVERSYLPVTVEFGKDDTEFIEQIHGWLDKQLIVNDLSELPDDPLGFSEAYSGINFKQYTLLMTYCIHDWTIDTYTNRYYRDNIEQSYNWAVCVGTASVPDNEAEQFYFTRFAILVRKLPTDANVKIWMSLGSLNWNWNN